MKVKLLSVFKAVQPLNKLANCEMSVKAAFKLTRLIKALSDVNNDIEAQRSNLVKKFGEQTPEGFAVTPANTPLFHQEFGALLNEEVEVAVDKLPLALYEDCKLTPAELFNIEDFLTE